MKENLLNRIKELKAELKSLEDQVNTGRRFCPGTWLSSKSWVISTDGVKVNGPFVIAGCSSHVDYREREEVVLWVVDSKNGDTVTAKYDKAFIVDYGNKKPINILDVVNPTELEDSENEILKA